jgi:RNA polymerase sigma-70 factor (ECF subfamily)
MGRPDFESESPPAGAEQFATTHWSMVLAARDRALPQAATALADLCGTYWYPLYAFVRRRGHTVEEAQDLTQEFFLRLLEKDYLQVVDRSKGRFRSFLLAAFEHFLLNEYDRQKAQKRGGCCKILALDFSSAEARYATEPAHTETPEKLFERRWALTLLDGVLQCLGDEYAQAGKDALFARLKPHLLEEPDAAAYAHIAAELNVSEAAVKMAVHRLRKRFRQRLHDEIARTLDAGEEIESEIRLLFEALAS